VTTAPFIPDLERDGYANLPAPFISRSVCERAAAEFDVVSAAGHRHLLDSESVRAVLADIALVQCVKLVLGPNAFAFKATLFDKHVDANWLVAWHQDRSIPVAQRIDVPGWSGWSVKNGVNYVQPPVEVLQGVLAARIHIDDCDVSTGPLRVLAGSHLLGKRAQTNIASLVGKFREITLTGEMGSVVLMRPLLLHASSKINAKKRRRVLHLEFAAMDLPGGLQWHRRIPLGR
jgi:ectoine hydroxylase-related dioxygenase (phytanoyl-CoA dioxygenase family)